jgi:hypothetical protein
MPGGPPLFGSREETPSVTCMSTPFSRKMAITEVAIPNVSHTKTRFSQSLMEDGVHINRSSSLKAVLVYTDWVDPKNII